MTIRPPPWLIHPVVQHVDLGRRQGLPVRDRTPPRSRRPTCPRGVAGNSLRILLASCETPSWAVCSRTSTTVVERVAIEQRPQELVLARGPAGQQQDAVLVVDDLDVGLAVHVGRIADARRIGWMRRQSVRRPTSSFFGVSSKRTGVISPSPPRRTCWLPSTCPVPRRERSAAAVHVAGEQLHGHRLSRQSLGLDVAGDRIAVARIGPHRRRQVVDADVLRLLVGADADGEDGDLDLARPA